MPRQARLSTWSVFESLFLIVSSLSSGFDVLVISNTRFSSGKI